MRRCDACGEPDTGWRATVRAGRRLCPACAQGVRRDGAAELAERRALLARLEAAGRPEAERLRRELRLSVERMERRLRQ